MAAVAIVLGGGGAWLAATRPEAGSEQRMLAAVPSPRLEQIVATVHPALEQVLEPVKSESEPLVLMTTYLIEVEAGRRARLAAHVANDEVMQPETIAVVRGLPEDVRLSEGSMIGPGLWILRPDLLPSVELDAASTANGRHELTLELRTPEGTVVSTGRTLLAIAPAVRGEDKPVAVAREPAAPADERVRSSALEPATASPKVAAPNGAPARKRATKKVRASSAPVEPDRGADVVKAPVKRKVKTAKPAREKRSPTRSRVMVLSAKPAVPRHPQPPRLVWPGDNPRSQSYSAGSPVFLGGFVPGAPRAQRGAPDGDANWRRRAFRR